MTSRGPAQRPVSTEILVGTGLCTGPFSPVEWLSKVRTAPLPLTFCFTFLFSKYSIRSNHRAIRDGQ